MYPFSAIRTSDTTPLLLASAGFGITFLGITVLSPLLPSIVEALSISSSQAGFGMSILWWSYAMGQYPGGHLSDVHTRKTVLLLGLGFGLIGAATLGLTFSYPLFLLGTFCFGTGTGLYQPASIALVSEMVPEKRSRYLGVLLASGDVAGAIAGILAVVVVSYFFWHTAFWLVAGLLVASSIGIYRAIDDDVLLPRFTGLNLKPTARRIFADTNLVVTIASFSLWMVVFQGVTSFLPAYLLATKESTVGLAGAGFSLIWGVGILIKPVAGEAGDRLGYLPIIGVTLSVCSLGLILLILSSTRLLLFAGICVFAAGLLATSPNVYAYITGLFPEATLGGDLGALRAVFTGFGGLGPVYIGVTAERFTYDVAFGGLVVCLLLGTLGVTWLYVTSK